MKMVQRSSAHAHNPQTIRKIVGTHEFIAHVNLILRRLMQDIQRSNMEKLNERVRRRERYQRDEAG